MFQKLLAELGNRIFQLCHAHFPSSHMIHHLGEFFGAFLYAGFKGLGVLGNSFV
jgi:hypothetical protein